jgi:Putative beta-barrel porin-2, OmpL-like. bbp2
MRKIITAGALALGFPAAVVAQEADTTPRLTFGAFVDTYYAYDFGRPESHDRAFTTQAARHDEFNVNLAHVSVQYAAPTTRARLALQAGTSVQVNYAFEPEEIGGQTNHLPLIQEATLGVAVAPTLWIDGGIFFSHIGTESWVSIDNPTYTRSLPSEFAPYYQAGVRATWNATPTLTAQLNVINGWNLVAENNEEKAVGVRLDWTAAPELTLSYSNFIGREPNANNGVQDMRVLNDFSARFTPSERTTVVGTVDLGSQEGDTWYAFSLVGRQWVTPALGINARVERFDDKDSVVSPELRTWGASVGVDVARGNAMWRTEARFFSADDEIFPDRDADIGFSETNTTLVTSLSIRI